MMWKVGLCQCPSLIAQKGRQCSAGIELGRQLPVVAPSPLPGAGPGTEKCKEAAKEGANTRLLRRVAPRDARERWYGHLR